MHGIYVRKDASCVVLVVDDLNLDECGLDHYFLAKYSAQTSRGRGTLQ